MAAAPGVCCYLFVLVCEIEFLAVIVRIRHTFQLGKGLLGQRPHIPVHTRHGCGDLAYRPASVCVVVHTVKMLLPEAGTLERAATYRDKKIKPLFLQIKNKVGAMAAQVKELTKEVENWKSKYQKLKQKYNGIQKELDDMRKENHKLSEEKNIMQGVSDRYDRVVRVLGIETVDAAVQQDIRNEKALEEKQRMEQMPKGSIHERLAWGIKRVRWRISSVRKINQKIEKWRDKIMEKHIYDEKNGLSYTLCGNYYLPDLVLNEEEPTYGKYGMLRKQFLKEHRPIRYQNLLLSGKLTAHLNQIDQEATEQVEVLMKQMVEKQGVNENLKRQDQMRWVRLMNNVKASAEEIVMREIIYV